MLTEIRPKSHTLIRWRAYLIIGRHTILPLSLGEWPGISISWCREQFSKPPFRINYSHPIYHRVVSKNTSTIAVVTLVWALMAVTLSILSVPWQDIIHYLHIIAFFGKPFNASMGIGIQIQKWSRIRTPHVFVSLRLNTLATLKLCHNSLQHTRNVCIIFIGPNVLQLSHCQ